MIERSEWIALREAMAIAGFNADASYPVKITRAANAYSPYGLLRITGVTFFNYVFLGEGFYKNYSELDDTLDGINDTISVGDVLVLQSSVLEQRITPECPKLVFKSAEETVFMPGHSYLVVLEGGTGRSVASFVRAEGFTEPFYPKNARYAYLGNLSERGAAQ